jgi:hypothetical protein
LSNGGVIYPAITSRKGFFKIKTKVELDVFAKVTMKDALDELEAACCGKC